MEIVATDRFTVASACGIRTAARHRAGFVEHDVEDVQRVEIRVAAVGIHAAVFSVP